MEKEKDEAKFIIEGNPGTGNTFIHIGKAINVNPNATTVNNTINITAGGDDLAATALQEAGEGKHSGKKLSNMSLRDMLNNDLIDTGNIQQEILNYVSCIRPLVKDELDKQYMQLWNRILEHDTFKVDLYDPGKQECKFNRNLIANILHYLASKGFYKAPYNQSEMARKLEGDDQNPVRKALRSDPDDKYCKAVDAIIRELKER